MTHDTELGLELESTNYQGVSEVSFFFCLIQSKTMNKRQQYLHAFVDAFALTCSEPWLG